tara:strand:- start:919 stop:2577 length:1659 start_codon:yes stop_codon:yes gene_type:complete
MLGIGVLLPLLKILTDDQFATSMPNLAKFISFFSIYDFKNFDLESEKLFRIKLIIGGCGIIVITFFIKFIFLSYYSFLLLNYKSQIQSYLSFELLKKYSNVELEYYFNKNSSELVRNITSDVSHFSSTIMSMIILLVEFFIFIGVFFILISQQPLNSLFTLLIFSLLIFTMYSLSKKKLLNYGIKRVEFEGERIKIINQIIEGFKQIKILGITQNIIKKFYFFNKNSFSLIAKIGFIGSAQRHFLEFFLVLCLSIIIFLIILKTKNYNELIYSIGLFSVAMFRLFPSFAKILSNFNNLRASRFSVVKVFNDLTEIPSENEKITDEKIQFKGQIAIKQLSFTYKSRPRKILENINLEIQKGEMIGFIGESGSGKSTLIELLMGFLKPSSGKILIDGKDIFENLREWRNQIGYVTQKNYLEDGTIASNIALGIPYNEINNQRINICVNEAQLDEFIKTLKDGIETKVGERGIQLSEGQRKRIEIARALYNNPEVLFLDEATSSLDKNTEKEFFKIIKNLKNKKTIIIISHDLHTLEDCDRIFNIYNNSLAIFKK